MVNYEQGKIYKIVCNNTGLVYYGSTCEARLSRRLAHHRQKYNKEKISGKFSITSSKVLSGENYEIVLVESCPCKNSEELHRKERYYIENHTCVNKYIPLRTDEEYRRDNADKIKIAKAICEAKSKERRTAIHQCLCGGSYSLKHKTRHERSLKHIEFIDRALL